MRLEINDVILDTSINITIIGEETLCDIVVRFNSLTITSQFPLYSPSPSSFPFQTICMYILFLSFSYHSSPLYCLISLSSRRRDTPTTIQTSMIYTPQCTNIVILFNCHSSLLIVVYFNRIIIGWLFKQRYHFSFLVNKIFCQYHIKSYQILLVPDISPHIVDQFLSNPIYIVIL